MFLPLSVAIIKEYPVLKDMQCKVIPVQAFVSEITLSGTEHVTFQLVVQCLN